MWLTLVFTISIYLLSNFAQCLILQAANKTVEPQQEYRPDGPLVLCKFL